MTTRSAVFEHAMIQVFADEGGLVNAAGDSGGLTNYGISQRSYPNVDIAHLTKEQAEDIYYRDFWSTGPYGQLTSSPLAEKVFNTAINAGNSRAFKLLQQAANACGASLVVDGAIGPISINTINGLDGNAVLNAYRSAQAAFYQSIVASNPSQAKFLKGWLVRAAR